MAAIELFCRTTMMYQWIGKSLKVREKNRHYINNEVLGLVGIIYTSGHYQDAINIVIEELQNQPFVEEKLLDEKLSSSEAAAYHKEHCTHLTISRHFDSFGKEYGHCIHCDTEFYL